MLAIDPDFYARNGRRGGPAHTGIKYLRCKLCGKMAGTYDHEVTEAQHPKCVKLQAERKEIVAAVKMQRGEALAELERR